MTTKMCYKCYTKLRKMFSFIYIQNIKTEKMHHETNSYFLGVTSATEQYKKDYNHLFVTTSVQKCRKI